MSESCAEEWVAAVPTLNDDHNSVGTLCTIGRLMQLFEVLHNVWPLFHLDI